MYMLILWILCLAHGMYWYFVAKVANMGLSEKQGTPNSDGESSCSLSSYHHWIGLRYILPENPLFDVENYGFQSIDLP